MVKGIDQFRVHFENFNDRYVLIGGAACYLAMEEVGLEFRVTKDLDIVLCAEDLDTEFVGRFWDFIKNDVLRLFQVIAPDTRVVLPGTIKDDLRRFIQAVEADPPKSLKPFGLGATKADDVIKTLRAIYELNT